jgi:leucyl aminopeptidase (aminopeptidase T)
MGAKRFSQIHIPTKSNADELGLEPSEYIYRMECAYDIDYEKMLNICNQAIKRVEPYEKIVLCSGEDCKLFFDLSKRKWLVDAGEGDLPCGEIYIAPNEDKTKGTVFFEQLFVENVGKYFEIKLYVEDGKVVGSNNEEITSYIQSLPIENTVVCELGFGMNPNVFNLCGYTVLDEKMANSFHIAIGANRMFGGNNVASVHLDFVGTGNFKILNNDEINKPSRT